MGDYTRGAAPARGGAGDAVAAQDPKKLVYALHNLANVHRAMGNLEPALVCLRRADEICRTHLLPIQRSFHLTSIAHIELQQGASTRALQTYREAVELSRRARHADGLAQSLRTLGEVLFGLGKHEDALPYLQEAAQLFAQLEDPAAEAEMRGRVGSDPRERTAAGAKRAEAWARVQVAAVGSWATRAGSSTRSKASRGRMRQLDGVAPRRVFAAFEAALALASTLGERAPDAGLRNTLGILEWNAAAMPRRSAHYEAALLLVARAGDRRRKG